MLKKKYFKTKDECEVTFEVNDQAEKVALVSESNGWIPVDMSLRKKDSTFYAKMRFPNDQKYEFRYLIDDYRWENDESADDYVSNEYGSTNSVVDTTR